MWVKHRVFIFSLVSLLILVSVLTMLAKQYPYFPIDLVVTSTIQTIPGDWFADLMLILSWVGYYPQAVVLIALVSLVVLWKWGRKQSLLLIISTVGAIIISIIFKAWVGRIRPDQTSFDSFPSGHVLFYMGLVGFLIYLIYTHLPKGALRFMLILSGFLLVILSGVSRMYLGFHWFSDVMGAYLLGLLWILIVTKVFRGYLR